MKKHDLKTIFRICIALMGALSITTTAWASSGGPGVNEDGTPKVVESTICGLPTQEEIDALTGPGVTREEPADEGPGHKGISLGMYTTTGYCNCEQCSGGHGLTYSGTVPKANHTISADLNVHPIGTKLMIDDIIYTVEDMGSSVKGNWIDIYYDNHDEAVAHGTKTQEVFTVTE